MTTYDYREMKCAVCGKTERYRILMSTNSFGFPDMDTRRTGMQRDTLGDEILICPHCGYVAYDITEEVPLKIRDFVLSPEYQKRDIKNTIGKSSDSYEALRDILLLKGDNVRAFWAAMKAAWVADDLGRSENAIQERRNALELLKSIELGDINEDLRVQLTAELLRRTGDFARAIEVCSHYQAKDSLLQNIIECEVLLSQNHESRCCNCGVFEEKIYGKKPETPLLTPPNIPGTYFDYTTFHVPRSDKTERLYEDSVWPAKSFNNYWNDVSYIKDGILRIAMADGVSAASSYTKIWADLLTMHYFFRGEDLLNHIVDYSKDWHEYALEAAKEAYYPQDPEMYRHDKCEIAAKGASTTFAGAELDIDNSTVNILTIGDTCFFIVRGDKCIAQVPNLGSPEKFTTCPHQIHDTNEKMDYEIERATIPFVDGDIIVGATDGVACWVVQPEEGWTMIEKLKSLINCKDFNDFDDLVEKERQVVVSTVGDRKIFAMHDDDSTICVLRITKIDAKEQGNEYEEIL